MDDAKWEQAVVVAGTFLGALLAQELHLEHEQIHRILNRHTYLITLAVERGLTHRQIASMVVESENLGPDLAEHLAAGGDLNLHALVWRCRHGQA